jgi:hypothetical protein
MANGLSHEQMRMVLRRAAEHEQRKSTETPATAIDVREIADEVGLAPEAVTRALTDLETGALDPSPERTLLDRVVGDGTVTVERHVARPLAEVQRAVDTFLEGQLYRLARRNGTRTLWRSDSSLLSRVRRGFDLTGRYELPRHSVVEVTAIAEGEGTRIRLVLGLEAVQKKRAYSLLGYVALGGGIVALGTTMADTAMWDGIMVAVGSGASLAGWGGVRTGQKRDVDAGAEGLERFLDQLG